uniref:C2H2-type domain-containing protein n=1 Tax=Meloidogyne javanica TaxID=6303 RepID=A0A915LEL8_MELJA
QAYEVLVDPQERAFYDRHRENIIYAGKFYSVYRDLFHQLAAEEYAYIDDPEDRNYPVFGTLNSDYETVVAPFYAFWLNFSTRRSFAWLDKYNLREADDRHTARWMERENRRERAQGKKKRNEEVQRLVEFVRKHDKRVEVARQRQAERNAFIMKKVEEQQRQAIRKNLEGLKNFEIDTEIQKEHLMDLEQIEAELDAAFGIVENKKHENEAASDEENLSDEEDEEQFYCIVCEKSFKSRNVLESHQRSKKHRQMAELLKIHMCEEDQKLFDEIGNNEDEEEKQKDDELIEQENNIPKKMTKTAKRKAAKQALKTEECFKQLKTKETKNLQIAKRKTLKEFLSEPEREEVVEEEEILEEEELNEEEIEEEEIIEEDEIEEEIVEEEEEINQSEERKKIIFISDDNNLNRLEYHVVNVGKIVSDKIQDVFFNLGKQSC